MTKGRLVAAVIAGTLLAPPVASEAQTDTGQVLREIGYLVEKKQSIEQQLEQNLDRKRDIEREFENLAGDEGRLENEGQSLDVEAQTLSQEIDNYSSYCTGTFEEPEYSIRKSWCDSNQGPLDSRVADYDRRVGIYNDAVDTFNRHHQSLVDRDDARMAEARAMKEEYDNASMRLQALEEILRLSGFAEENQDCANMPVLEDMHQCMQSIWDGARRTQ